MKSIKLENGHAIVIKFWSKRIKTNQRPFLITSNYPDVLYEKNSAYNTKDLLFPSDGVIKLIPS